MGETSEISEIILFARGTLLYRICTNIRAEVALITLHAILQNDDVMISPKKNKYLTAKSIKQNMPNNRYFS